jgi:hypothetical protein
MRIPFSAFLCALLLSPAVARADDHRADWYGGFSGGSGASKLAGFYNAFAIPLPSQNPRLHRMSLLTDVSVQFGKHDGQSVSQVVYMAGAKYTFARREQKNKVSAHILGGTEYYNTAGNASNTGVLAFGVGYEFIPAPTSSNLLDGLGVRVQVDSVFRSGDRENFWRVSGGLIYRFGQH